MSDDLAVQAARTAAALEDSGLAHHAAVVRSLLAEHGRTADQQRDATHRARLAFKNLSAALIAVSDRLQKPYTDAPEHTPWRRLVLPRMTALRGALDDMPPTVDELTADRSGGDE